MKKQFALKNQDDTEFVQPNVIHLFSLVGMFITLVMGIIELFNEHTMLASILFVASFVYFLGYFAFTRLNNSALSAAIILYSLYLLMFYLVYSGGVENTGPLWIFMVAPVSVFIHGLKRGLIDIAGFLIIISLIMFFPIEIMDHAVYSIEFKLRLIYSFLTVTFLSALYEYSREKSYLHTVELSKKYRQLANLDPLTQLSNRRDALNILKREQVRMKRNKEPLSVILCDIDFFKKINDHYGHNAGDTVLVELAKLFKHSIREQDCVARWGGEEFLFILPQTTAENANIIAEKIQENIHEFAVPIEGEEVSITVSMGIEQLDRSKNIDNVINSADKYLYQAKDAGRNQIFPKHK
ncbi:GGDEF domain-containing protein [Colwellia sp. KU-HH00111]|uniref:GGDEF domain-containing protein n=1 Tax=Colwellia sp. KU-HH00111 TaxID=3127652 RepID=UPI00310B7334